MTGPHHSCSNPDSSGHCLFWWAQHLALWPFIATPCTCCNARIVPADDFLYSSCVSSRAVLSSACPGIPGSPFPCARHCTLFRSSTFVQGMGESHTTCLHTGLMCHYCLIFPFLLCFSFSFFTFGSDEPSKSYRTHRITQLKVIARV